MAVATARAMRSPSAKSEKLPHTFKEALKQGGAVISDKSSQSINQKRRQGKLTMQKRGAAGLLTVDYVGRVRGYQFSVPKFVD